MIKINKKTIYSGIDICSVTIPAEDKLAIKTLLELLQINPWDSYKFQGKTQEISESAEFNSEVKEAYNTWYWDCKYEDVIHFFNSTLSSELSSNGSDD